ncbi:hypothetical protein ABKN59_000729 [Abortiporus biennis]
MATPYAFVTLVSSDSYLPGALTQAAALREVHPSPPVDPEVAFQTVCLVTPETVDVSSIKALRNAFDLVVGVEIIEQLDNRGLQLLGRPDLHSVLTKLHIFRLTQYSKIIFLDADVLPIRPLSHLFKLPHEFSAAPDVGWPDIFNSGVLVLSPGDDKFNELNELFKTKGTWDGGDQGLLNEWRGSNWNRLSFTYNTTPTAAYTYAPAYERFGSQISAIHFIGPNKPWKSIPFRDPGLKYAETPHGVQQAYDYSSLLDRWFEVYDRHYRTIEPVPRSSNDFGVQRYTSAWEHTGLGAEYPATSAPPSGGGPLGLQELKKIAIEGSSSVSGIGTSQVGQYKSMPLEGRIDLMRPRKAEPVEEQPSPSTQTGDQHDGSGGQLTAAPETYQSAGPSEYHPQPVRDEQYFKPLEQSFQEQPFQSPVVSEYASHHEIAQSATQHEATSAANEPPVETYEERMRRDPPLWVPQSTAPVQRQYSPPPNAVTSPWEITASPPQQPYPGPPTQVHHRSPSQPSSQSPQRSPQQSSAYHHSTHILYHPPPPPQTQSTHHHAQHVAASPEFRHGHERETTFRPQHGEAERYMQPHSVPQGQVQSVPRVHFRQGSPPSERHAALPQEHRSPRLRQLSGGTTPASPQYRYPGLQHQHQSHGAQQQHEQSHRHVDVRHSPQIQTTSSPRSPQVQRSPWSPQVQSAPLQRPTPSQHNVQRSPQSYHHSPQSPQIQQSPYHQPHSSVHQPRQPVRQPQPHYHQPQPQHHHQTQPQHQSPGHPVQQPLRSPSPPKVAWNPAVEPPPKATPSDSSFPVDTYFPNVWDQIPSKEHDATYQTFPLPPSTPTISQDEAFFHPPPAAVIPEQLLREGQYASVIGQVSVDESHAQSSPTVPTPDRNKVKSVFPWEEKPRHVPKRVFPSSDSPPPVANFIEEEKPIAPPAPEPSRRPQLQIQTPSPPVGFPPNLAYVNAWDVDPTIQRYASKLARPNPFFNPLPPPPPRNGWRKLEQERERTRQEKEDASSMDGDDEDEGSDDDDRYSARGGRSRSSSTTTPGQKRTKKEYRSRAVQTDNTGMVEASVQAAILREEVVHRVRTDSATSTRSSVATYGTRRDWPSTSSVSSSLLPSAMIRDTVYEEDRMTGTPMVTNKSSLPFPSTSPTGIRSPHMLGSPRTYSPPIGVTPPKVPSPPKVASPRTAPARPSVGIRRTSGSLGSPKVTGSPQAIASPRPGQSPRTSLSTGRPESPVVSRAQQTSPPLMRSISTETGTTLSPATSMDSLATPENTPIVPQRKPAGRAWDPARGVDVFKRGSEEVLARFLRMGSFSEESPKSVV